MNDRKLNILILTYYFPPDPNISSRRWVKFAKYLQELGHQVTVLAAEANSKVSPWDKDMNNLNVVRYKRNYPAAIDSIPEGIIDKLKYKLSFYYLKSRVTGTIYDRTVFLKDTVLNAAASIIAKQKCEVLITNGPPHRIMYYGTLLKKRFPDLTLVSDFRDPWTWWYNYGYPFLRGKHKDMEEQMESEVMKFSDLVTIPALEMKNHLKKKYADANLFLLPHAFDPEEIIRKESVPKVDDGKIRLIYFGNLYSGEDKRFDEVADSIEKNENIYLDIFSDTSNYRQLFEKRGLLDRVRYHNTIAAPELFKRLSDYDAFLYVYPEKFKNIFSSKFYEIVHSGLPIILICTQGEVSDFVVKNNIGYSIHDQISEKLTTLFNAGIKIDNTDKSIVEKYSFKSIASDLIETIIRSRENHVVTPESKL